MASIFSKADSPDPPRAQLYTALTAFYILLIVYSSLMPWSGWRMPTGHVLHFLVRPISQVSRRSLVSNFLAYIPLGVLLAGSHKKRTPAHAFLRATLAGAALSFSMETLQSLVPYRTPSNLDLLSNTAGTMIGAALTSLARLETPARRLLLRARNEFRNGPVVSAGLAAVALWALSEWSPLVPVFQTEQWRENIAPLWQAMGAGGYRGQPLEFATYLLHLAAVLLLIGMLQNEGKRGLRTWAFLAGCVVLAKPLFFGHPLSLEALGGSAAGILLAFLCLRWRWRAEAAMLMLLAVLAAYPLQGRTWGYTGFNWVPFWMQIQNRIEGFASILQTVWPAMGLGCLAVLTSGRGRHRTVRGVAGGLLLAVVMCSLEWAQSRNRHGLGDITPVLLALGGWSLPWFLSQEQESGSSSVPVSPG